MVVLHWVWFVAFLVAAIVVDRWVLERSLSVGTTARQAFRIVVLVIAALWVLALTGVLAKLGIGF